MSIPQELLGTIPGWITSAGVIALLGIVLRYRLGSRRLSIEGQKQHDADAADRRDHIAEEMAALRTNISLLRKELHDCEEQCREQIRDLQEELWGEKRQRVAEQLSLINIILDKVDAPDLQNLRATLESIQVGLKPPMG